MTAVEMGRRVRDLRRAAGLTMQDLATKLPGVHFTTIGKLETGKMKFTSEWIEALAGALAVPAASLIDDSVEHIADAPTVGTQLNNLRISLGLSFSEIATGGGWRGPSSVQRYFQPHYDLPMRRELADRIAETLGTKVHEISDLASHPSPPLIEVKEPAAIRLREARINAGHSSAASAAAILNWEAGTYRHHENGTRNFGVGQAIQYAAAFNVSADWLLLGGQAERSDEILEINGVPQPDRVIVNGIAYVRQGVA